MTPTEPGYYWLRQNWKSQVSDVINKGSVECVLIGNFPKPGSRGPNRKYVMMVIGRHWMELLEKAPGYWQWSGPIQVPQFPEPTQPDSVN